MTRLFLLAATGGLFGLLAASPLAAQSGQWNFARTYESGQLDDEFGNAVCGLGDVDGDGFDDFAVGAPRHDQGGSAPGDGAVFVYSGATRALIRTHYGATTDGRFGAAVANAGDLDGDQVADLLVGAPDSVHFTPGGEGAVFLYSGASGALLDEVVGQNNLDRFGTAVCSIGDVNGDSVADFVVGARGYDTAADPDCGRVYVYSGATRALLATVNGIGDFAHFGDSLAAVGDLNGDGVGDWIAGAPEAPVVGLGGDTGYVRVMSGATTAQIHYIAGSEQGARYGHAVCALGDLDGDGYGEFAVGAEVSDQGGSEAGAVLVHSGMTGITLYRFDGAQATARLGSSLCGGGDLDGDGLEEIVAGAPGESRVYVFDGATGNQVQQLDNPGSAGEFGAALAVVGDLEGDGLDDFVVGARGLTGAVDAGAAHLYRQLDLPGAFDWTYNASNTRWYAMEENQTWLQATALADTYPDVDLATVRNLDEHQWIYDTLMGGSGFAYIGYNDENQEGFFVWRSGEFAPWWINNGYLGVGGVPGYWYFQEPNNLNNEDYVTIGRAGGGSTNGEWNDTNGTVAHSAIFEWFSLDTPFLTYGGTCPGSGPVSCINLTPGGSAAFIYGNNGAATVNAGTCGPTTLGLGGATLLFLATVDPNGQVSFNGNVPAGACGAIVAQVLDVSTCSLSNVLAL